jgi:hypothetical protein
MSLQNEYPVEFVVLDAAGTVCLKMIGGSYTASCLNPEDGATVVMETWLEGQSHKGKPVRVK